MDIQTLVQTYLADSTAQADQQDRIQRRATNIAQLRAITQRFIARQINLAAFRTELETELRSGEDWGATGPGFLMNMHKLVNSHNDSDIAETYLRGILSGLTASNLGPRIEQFYQFLLNERARLRHANKGNNVAVAAGNSAFILSLFAAWLDSPNQPDIYYPSLREGLYKLVKATIVPAPEGLNLGGRAVEVHTNAEHIAYVQLIQSIKSHVPPQLIVPYWAESFGYWAKNYSIINDPPPPPPNPKQEQFLENDPLMPTPEPLLTQLIREIQHEILVEEPVIRRIYHALLAGHVILSGPPGTGKTHLARLIPEILWKSEIQTKVSTKINNHSQFPLQHLSQRQVPQARTESIWEETASTQPMWDGPVGEASTKTETTATQPMEKTAETVTRILTAEMAYTTHLVTATDEWSVRTLISGITPVSKNGNVTYEVQDGHLTAAIKKNWSTQSDVPENGETPPRRRSPVTSNSGIEPGTPQTFRGQWLVIDEFNRAPIDLALGDALTALGGGNDVLGKLPISKDFRIIGTLNSFDRNYLNQISEALKRRFSFVEILPPGRSLREAEQAIVLYKSLQLVSHLSKEIISEDEAISWGNIVVEADSEGQYSINWPDEPHPFQKAFEAAWCVFEVIRIYRQLGTAQAISLVRHMLIAGILQGYTTRAEWVEQALDAALCDTIADQLQVLLPDEIDALLLYLTSESSAFGAAYNQLLSTLANRRLYAQLFALGNVSNPQDQAYLSDEKIEAIAQSNPPTVATEKLTGLFHLTAPAANLPQFKRRLRTFKAERGL